jgi:mono/diheme cytochrome c family protein
MNASQFLNQWRRVRLIRVSVIAALGCLVCGEVSAQSTPASLGQKAVPSLENTARQAEMRHVVVLLATVGVLDSKPEGGALPSPSSDQNPTYLRDVLPILMGKCSRCHNQQARFVYNWLDYKTAFADRWEIRRRVWDSWKGSYFKESMPIANSPESIAITDVERETIRKWVTGGGVRGVPPPPDGPKSKAERIELGRRLFSSICAACHQPTGQGLPNVFPPLAGSDFLNADKNRAIKIVINGRQGEVLVNGLKFNNSMPSFPLSDQDIANALTFVYNSFGNSGLEVTQEEVKALRAQPPDPSGPPPTSPQPKSQFE